jgi:iron complex transport system ATP-binding protein
VLDHVANYCNNLKGTAVAAMHDLSLAAKYADRIICLSEGRIIADGTPGKVLTKALIRKVYRVEADVFSGTNGVLHITALAAC